MNLTLKSILLLFVIFIIGCSNSKQQKVDVFLDEYEAVVVQWESKIVDGEFTAEDSDEMNTIIANMEDKSNELQKVTKWTRKQQERYANLSERIMEAIFKSMNIPEGFAF